MAYFYFPPKKYTNLGPLRFKFCLWTGHILDFLRAYIQISWCAK